MAITGYEIDLLPVGEESKSGDAILFRYKEDGADKVILIDGGHEKSGNVKTSETILNHMRKYYYPDASADSDMRIDHIICSHPDSDHVGGLQEIMEKCDVGTLWINNPIDYTSKSSLAEDSDKNSFSKLDAETVEDLINVAKDNCVTIDCPLQGKKIGPLVVASPSKEFYETLVKGVLDRQGKENASFKSLLERATQWIGALWNDDHLKDYPATSVCNESSTVLFGELMDEPYRILLTADAGIEALSRTYDYLFGQHNFQKGSLEFMQTPHHGGRHNVNTETLDKILGNKISERGDENRGWSLASVAKKADDHPKKAVTNAFMTRGYSCASTKGMAMRHRRGEMPDRDDYSPVAKIEYSSLVEAIDN